MMVVAVIYILNKGIEVFARAAEIYMLIIILLGLTSCFLVIAAGLVKLDNLFPLQALGLEECIEISLSKYMAISVRGDGLFHYDFTSYQKKQGSKKNRNHRNYFMRIITQFYPCHRNIRSRNRNLQ